MKTLKDTTEHCLSSIRSFAVRGTAFIKRHPRILSVTGLALISFVMLFTVTATLSRVVVDDNGTTYTLLTLGRTPETILAGAGITLADDDVVTAQLDGTQKRISIERAFDVSIIMNDGTSTVVRLTSGTTVSDALKLAGVTVTDGTVTDVAGTTPVTDGLNINVEQFESAQRTQTEEVPFITTYRYSETLPMGSRQVLTEGKVGEKTYTYRDYLQDGAVVRSDLLSEELTVQPVNAVVMVGQGKVSEMAEKYPLDENGVPQGYKTVLNGKACAYTAPAGSITATGTVPQIGTVAVNPKIIPYGSKLFIASDDGYVYGYATAEDTGGALVSNRILADLYMDTDADCYAFGRRNVKVYILE